VLSGYVVLKMKHLITYALSLLLLMGATATDGVSCSVLTDKFPSGIAGRLTDLNGAVIAGARIRIIARSTKQVFLLETDPKGEYVADLGPGVYDVEAEAAGFKKAKRKSISVLRDAQSYVDFVMEIKEETTDPKHP
jgi:Carboxypeptidase regulatory-like domain